MFNSEYFNIIYFFFDLECILWLLIFILLKKYINNNKIKDRINLFFFIYIFDRFYLYLVSL